MDDSFYERLETVMFLRKIKTHRKLSELTGIDNGTISRWKNEKITPADGSIKKLSDALDCRFDYLKFGTGNCLQINETDRDTIVATDPINSFNDIKENQDCKIILKHTTNQQPQRGKCYIDLSEKEERIISALRKIGKDDYTDGLLERVEAAAKALSWE